MIKLITFLKSMKLAVILISYLIFSFILASIIPQNMPLDYYENIYPGFVSWIIVKSHYNSFFTSLLFLIPITVFFINLLLCTISRFRKEIKKEGKRNFGPDIIHLGILIILVGGLISFLTRTEEFAYLGPGDSVDLPGNYQLRLASFDILKYNDDSIKDWISTVEILQYNTVIYTGEIEVNKPLSLGVYKVYQNSYQIDATVYLKKEDDKLVKVKKGQGYKKDGTVIIFAGLEEIKDGDTLTKKVVFEEWDNTKRINKKILDINDKIDKYTVHNFSNRKLSGLSFILDLGIYPVWTGLVVFFLGLAWTFMQKIGVEATAKRS